MSHFLDEKDQKIQDNFLKVLNSSLSTKDRKVTARTIIDDISMIVFNKTNLPQATGAIQRMVNLINANIIPSNLETGVYLIVKEGNKAAHGDIGDESYTESIAICLIPIVRWYLYNHRNYGKKDLKIEKAIDNYMQRKKIKLLIGCLAAGFILLLFTVFFLSNKYAQVNSELDSTKKTLDIVVAKMDSTAHVKNTASGNGSAGNEMKDVHVEGGGEVINGSKIGDEYNVKGNMYKDINHISVNRDSSKPNL